MLVVLSATFTLVDLFVAVMQLEVSAAFMMVKVSAANVWVTIFIDFMHMGVSVGIMPVVFSLVHYAHDFLLLLCRCLFLL